MESDEKIIEIRRHIFENAIRFHENVIHSLKDEMRRLEMENGSVSLSSL
jgi:hypothetical protein